MTAPIAAGAVVLALLLAGITALFTVDSGIALVPVPAETTHYATITAPPRTVTLPPPPPVTVTRTVRVSRSVSRLNLNSPPKRYAASLVSSAQMRCLLPLWAAESSWSPRADNPTSSAFGIAQRLGEKSTDYRVQIRQGLKYIAGRYGTPCRAWAFHQSRGWY